MRKSLFQLEIKIKMSVREESESNSSEGYSDESEEDFSDDNRRYVNKILNIIENIRDETDRCIENNPGMMVSTILIQMRQYKKSRLRILTNEIRLLTSYANLGAIIEVVVASRRLNEDEVNILDELYTLARDPIMTMGLRMLPLNLMYSLRLEPSNRAVRVPPMRRDNLQRDDSGSDSSDEGEYDEGEYDEGDYDEGEEEESEVDESKVDKDEGEDDKDEGEDDKDEGEDDKDEGEDDKDEEDEDEEDEDEEDEDEEDEEDESEDEGYPPIPSSGSAKFRSSVRGDVVVGREKNGKGVKGEDGGDSGDGEHKENKGGGGRVGGKDEGENKETVKEMDGGDKGEEDGGHKAEVEGAGKEDVVVVE